MSARTPPLPQPSAVAVVIVAYRPTPAIVRCLEAACAQAGRVIVVDNTPDDSSEALFAGLATRLPFERLAVGANIGQAAGLNRGFARAAELGLPFVLTLDQDSVPRPDLLARLCAIWRQLPAGRPAAVLGANYQAEIQGRTKLGFADAAGRGAFFENVTAITSGSLTPLAAFDDIGPFREEFFIDHVDHDWCLRARAKGYGIYIASEPLLTHVIGAVSYHRVLGKTLETSNHSAARRYFWHRNGAVLVREYLRREPDWCLKLALFHFPAALLTMTLFEHGKPAKLAAVARGLWDGLRRDFGRNPILKSGN